MSVTISGMTGRGSIRHNNRMFSSENIDRSRTGLNITFCCEDLKQIYHQVFDEALAAYNAKKKKTRVRYQTTMSISARASRRSCSMRSSFRSATKTIAAAARWMVIEPLRH